MLARREDGLHLLAMRVVGRGHMDGIDIVGQELIERGIGMGHAMTGGPRHATLGGGAKNAANGHPGTTQHLHVNATDEAGPDDRGREMRDLRQRSISHLRAGSSRS